MSWKENKQSIKCRFLGDSIKFIVLWPPHRSLEHRIYDFSNPTSGAVKLHCPSLVQTNGCGFSGGPIATQGFCFWWWVKSHSQQIECTICTVSRLASSCAALLLCSRCQQYELERKETIHQMSLFKQFNRCHRFVASPQKSGAPNLRLFQPYFRRRQTSLSQPCSN